MKLATIEIDGVASGACALSERELAPLSELVTGVSSVRELIAAGGAAMQKLESAVKSEQMAPKARRFPINAVRWMAPIPDSQRIFCVALNNRALDHYAIELSKVPTYFEKPGSSLIGNGQNIVLAPHYGLTHPEPELGVIIGRETRNIALDKAMDHVFGYAIFNDVTSPDMRREDHFQFRFPYLKPGDNDFHYVEEHTTYPARYKGADTFGPMGPWLVTKEEIADPQNLTVRCWLDDEIIMDDSTRNMRFSVSEVVYWIAAHCTLRAGDIVSMGTALSTDQNARPLSYGNMNRFGANCRIEIEGLGVLSNPIVRTDMPDPRTVFLR